ncbi:hypothetical protein Zmor_020935 [Zophobas morio]|uniref:Uncharacterized protein n=1 Tax=Zophobas morio TaxID=2755281 RepID=A0AA38I4E0_9CUCU|nr:hypothetical protein Zmor_020935 [Zophobas morio]
MSHLLFLLLLCYNLLDLNLGEYEPPKSAAYPFGDEALNADMREDRVPDEGREINIELIKDIYTFCLNTTDGDSMYDEGPDNDSKCAKCDVRPTVDKRGVLVECYNCTDNIDTVTVSQQESSPEHILFLTTYLEIANYSAPEE